LAIRHQHFSEAGCLTPARFPPSWSVDDPDPKLDRQCFIVRDANGQALAFVYLEEEPKAEDGRQDRAAKQAGVIVRAPMPPYRAAGAVLPVRARVTPAPAILERATGAGFSWQKGPGNRYARG
jgi:hypothetical protein